MPATMETPEKTTEIHVYVQLPVAAEIGFPHERGPLVATVHTGKPSGCDLPWMRCLIKPGRDGKSKALCSLVNVQQSIW